MGVIDLFGADKKEDALTLRISELEARQARIERVLARQRHVEETLLDLLENTDWDRLRKAFDKALAIE